MSPVFESSAGPGGFTQQIELEQWPEHGTLGVDGLIEWASVDGDRFERASQMLLSRLHDGVRARADRGG